MLADRPNAMKLVSCANPADNKHCEVCDPLDQVESPAENSRRRRRRTLLGSAMLPISSYVRSALLWAMIPLTVFASRPVTGCMCASGEYKLFCMAHVLHGTAVQDSNRNGRKCE